MQRGKKLKFHQHLKNHFIPHKGNNWHPRALHAKRIVGYGAFLVAIKAFVIAYAFFLPIQAYLAPDVVSAQTDKIIAMTNDLRKSKGLGTVSRVGTLNSSAALRVQDMLDLQYFSHYGPDGHTLSYFLNKAGYNYSVAGENLAVGYSDADSVMTAWIASPEHYSNLIDKDFTQIGVALEEGTFQDTDTVFVAQHFGVPRDAAPTVAVAPAPTPAPKPKPAVKEIPKPTPQPVVPTRAPPPAPEPTPEPAPVAEVPIVTPPEVAATSSDNVVAIADEPSTSTPAVLGTIVTPPAQPPVVRDPQAVINTGKTTPTPWQKYLQARDWFAPVLSVFSISHRIFLAFLIFFAVALALMVFVEIRKQHPHVIFKTLGLIAVLLVLVKF